MTKQSVQSVVERNEQVLVYDLLFQFETEVETRGYLDVSRVTGQILSGSGIYTISTILARPREMALFARNQQHV